MGSLSVPTGLLQVLQGLETYITTEKFLHTLEAASAEWIDLSDHQQHPHKGWSPPSSSCELELQQVCMPWQALHAASLSQTAEQQQPSAFTCKDALAIVCAQQGCSTTDTASMCLRLLQPTGTTTVCIQPAGVHSALF
jgi:hypothetical protein